MADLTVADVLRQLSEPIVTGDQVWKSLQAVAEAAKNPRQRTELGKSEFVISRLADNLRDTDNEDVILQGARATANLAAVGRFFHSDHACDALTRSFDRITTIIARSSAPVELSTVF